MTLTLFCCDRIRSRLSPAQCAHLWRKANGPTTASRKGEHVRVARRECVGCEVGDAHARDAVAPGVELFPAESLIVARRDHHVSPPVQPSAPSEDEMAAKFTDEQKAEAVRRVAEGERAQAVAEELGCSQTAIYQWRGKSPEKPRARRTKPVRAVAKEKASQRAKRLGRQRAKPAVERPKVAPKPFTGFADEIESSATSKAPTPYTVAAPSRVAHEDVIAFLARLPPMPWCLGDAIRLLAFHAIDGGGDLDDVTQARERIYAYLLARGEAA